MAVHEDHGDHLHERDHDKTDGTCEAVEHLQPVLSGTGAEDKPDEKAHDANDS